MTGMRVVFGVVALKAPRSVHDIAHIVAAVVSAELFGSDFLARIQHAIVGHGVVVGYPCAYLGKLFSDNRIVAIEAILARLGMLRYQHARITR